MQWPVPGPATPSQHEMTQIPARPNSSVHQKTHPLARPILYFLSLLYLPNLPLAPAQQSAPITVNVNAVNLLATVRDKHGALVNNLSKDDFVLTQDAKPQTITYFAKESDLPLTLGLLVDTSLSQRRVLDQELSASRSFLDHLLREDKDKAFVIHFDYEVELLQDLTSSRQKLETAIDQIHSPQFSQTSTSGGNSGSGSGGHGSHGHGGAGTLLYDAVYLASDELMKKQQGRKALIILTDGVDRGSKESLGEAIETAQRADTLVYCILFADKEGYGGGGGGYGGPHMGGGMGGHGGGLGGGGMGGHGGDYPRRTEESRPDGKKVLQQLAKISGGRFFEVSKKEPLDKIYAAIDEELRNQYVLGYTPDKPDATPGYHKLSLTVKPKDHSVQTRDGFYLDH
jgi:VWFA-related protein